jgi:adenylate cyclase
LPLVLPFLNIAIGADMALEIERKFLVADDSWRHSAARRVHIRDGLVATDNGRKVRIRISDESATIAVKGPRAGITRAEFEYAIPPSDAEEIMRTLPPCLRNGGISSPMRESIGK